jgi:preprotein translocase subunit SecG
VFSCTLHSRQIESNQNPLRIGSLTSTWHPPLNIHFTSTFALVSQVISVFQFSHHQFLLYDIKVLKFKGWIWLVNGNISMWKLSNCPNLQNDYQGRCNSKTFKQADFLNDTNISRYNSYLTGNRLFNRITKLLIVFYLIRTCILEWNCIMTNVMYKFLIYLSIYFCVTCFGLSFSPSSEAGEQFQQWFKSPGYTVSTLALTVYPGEM